MLSAYAGFKSLMLQDSLLQLQYQNAMHIFWNVCGHFDHMLNYSDLPGNYLLLYFIFFEKKIIEST